MGRIQKKKTSRKKKGQDNKQVSDPLLSGSAVAEKAPSSFVPSIDVKKRQALTQKKQSGIIKLASGQKAKGYIDKGLQFLREVKVELKKVTWPTRKQTFGSTAIVIILVVIISLFLGIVDVGLSSLVRVVLQ